jgi:hypothetical protein
MKGFLMKTNKPPLGLMPRTIAVDTRLDDVFGAISRNYWAEMPIPPEWLAEYHEQVHKQTIPSTTLSIDVGKDDSTTGICVLRHLPDGMYHITFMAHIKPNVLSPEEIKEQIESLMRKLNGGKVSWNWRASYKGVWQEKDEQIETTHSGVTSE